MTHDMVKFERGQVWKLYVHRESELRGHEQSLSRPWLVLSLGVYNNSCGMITAVPITSQDKRETPAHVHFKNNQGDDNVILCEQIRSFDTNYKDYRFDYMGIVSPEIMDKVDVALSIHQGLHYSPITLKSLYDTMENMIKSVSYLESKKNTPKFTDADILEFTTKLKEVAATVEPQMDTVPQVITKEEINVDHVIPQVVLENVQKEEHTKVKPARIKWTPELAEEFLQDTEDLPMKEVMKKWDIYKKTKYYSMRTYAQQITQKKN